MVSPTSTLSWSLIHFAIFGNGTKFRARRTLRSQPAHSYVQIAINVTSGGLIRWAYATLMGTCWRNGCVELRGTVRGFHRFCGCIVMGHYLSMVVGYRNWKAYISICAQLLRNRMTMPKCQEVFQHRAAQDSALQMRLASWHHLATVSQSQPVGTCNNRDERK